MTTPVRPRKAAVAAQRAEAAGVSEVDVVFQGHTYRIDTDIDLGVFEALSSVDDDGNRKSPDFKAAVQALLGPEQWKLWRSKHSKVSELMAFMSAGTEATRSGKSSTSSAS